VTENGTDDEHRLPERGGHGRFVPDPATIERDAEAARRRTRCGRSRRLSGGMTDRPKGFPNVRYAARHDAGH
jgi:hypothetical protein